MGKDTLKFWYFNSKMAIAFFILHPSSFILYLLLSFILHPFYDGFCALGGR